MSNPKKLDVNEENGVVEALTASPLVMIYFATEDVS